MKKLIILLILLLALPNAILRKFDDDRSERWYQGYGEEENGITLTRYNKVGIVTTNPSVELEVVGEIKSTKITATNLDATNLESDLDGTGYDLTIKNINATGTVTAGVLSILELSVTTLNSTYLNATSLLSGLDGTGFNITANTFIGTLTGAATTANNSETLDFLDSTYFTNADNISSGTLGKAYLDSEVVTANYSSPVTINGDLTATNLKATNLEVTNLESDIDGTSYQITTTTLNATDLIIGTSIRINNAPTTGLDTTANAAVTININGANYYLLLKSL